MDISQGVNTQEAKRFAYRCLIFTCSFLLALGGIGCTDQAQTRGDVLSGVNQFGVAPGGRKMIDSEESAAEHAIQTGIYGVYRSITGQECTRIGPTSKCFCGHLHNQHSFMSKSSAYPRCTDCSCTAFKFVPTRPEEVGEWWLVRRKGFNVHTWRAKCRCGHSHEEHDPKHMRCRCGCSHFQSNFACLACDKKWEDHETVFEDARERLSKGLAIGDDFKPLANDPAMRQAVFPHGTQSPVSSATSYQPNRLRPAAVRPEKAEKSVQIMHETSGGRIRNQDVVNRYGRVAEPPKQWLYMGGAGPGQLKEASAKPLNHATPSICAQAGRPVSRDRSGGLITNAPNAAPQIANSRQRVPKTSALTVAQGYGVDHPDRDLGANVEAKPKTMASGFRPVYD